MQPSFGSDFQNHAIYSDGSDGKWKPQRVSALDATVYKRCGVREGITWHLTGPGEAISFRLVGRISSRNEFRVDVAEAWETMGLDYLNDTHKTELIKALKERIEEETGLTVPMSFNRGLLMDARGKW